MDDPGGGDRKSVSAPPALVTDPDELARKDASNALRQADAVTALIEGALSGPQAFKLRPSILLRLNRFALEGTNSFAGNYRPSGIYITGSRHQPPPVDEVAGLVEDMCEYVNQNLATKSALHLAAYVMWRVNWIHPFDDGNGRTGRAASYLALCVKLGYRLTGKKSILKMIEENKGPYYKALEAADAAWADNGRVDLTVLEGLLEKLLGALLVSVLEEAKGQSIA